MKINILNKDDFSSKEKQFLEVLEDSNVFWYIVSIARKRAKIPNEGFPVVLKHNKPVFIFNKEGLFKKILNNKNLFDSASTICSIYGLPKYWLNTFFSIILTNTALPSQKKDNPEFQCQYIGGLSGLIEQMSPKKMVHLQELRLIIRENISIKDIKKLLDENKTKINKYLSYLPISPERMNSFGKQKNLEIKKEMRNYKREGLSLSQIADRLAKEYKDNISFELDKDQIATYQKRYADFLKSLIKNKISYDLYLDDTFAEIIKSSKRKDNKKS